MREMPIVFAAEEVRATLDGRKTQYRCPLSARNCLVDGASMSAKRWDAKRWDWGSAWVDDGPSPAGNPGPYLHVISLAHWTTHRIYPRVQPGDRLWVRETAHRRPMLNLLTGEPLAPKYDGGAYSADDEDVLNPEEFDICWWYSRKVCPAIHMPRWASRITLEVTGVRVERLKDISEADARAEGVGNWQPDSMRYVSYKPVADFRELWESINGSGSWDANPWVWVVEFARVSP